MQNDLDFVTKLLNTLDQDSKNRFQRVIEFQLQQERDKLRREYESHYGSLEAFKKLFVQNGITLPSLNNPTEEEVFHLIISFYLLF